MGGYTARRDFEDFGVVKFVEEGLADVKPAKKAVSSKTKMVPKPARAKKSSQGEVSGPDERRPDTKADEIYGDTKIPPSHRK
jgi:hypothetical protein